MRASSLQSVSLLALNREIGSRYDAVVAVSDKLDVVEAVANINVEALLTELEQAKDFSGISVVAGSFTGFDPLTKVITIETIKGDTGDVGPKGDTGATGPIGPIGPRGLTGAKGAKGDDGADGQDGVNGLNGMVPVLEFSIDADGDLAFEVIGYEEGPAIVDRFQVEEW